MANTESLWGCAKEGDGEAQISAEGVPREEDSFPHGEGAAREGFMEEEVLGRALKDGYLTAVCVGKDLTGGLHPQAVSLENHEKPIL